MDTTTKFSSESTEEASERITVEGDSEVTAEKGFLGQLAQSIFEPGANHAVVLAMNVSFFLLLIVLFGLAFLTQWNFHVIMLLVCSACLWGAMIWFVIEIQKVLDRPDNMPPNDLDPSITSDTDLKETAAKLIPETRKDR